MKKITFFLTFLICSISLAQNNAMPTGTFTKTEWNITIRTDANITVTEQSNSIKVVNAQHTSYPIFFTIKAYYNENGLSSEQLWDKHFASFSLPGLESHFSSKDHNIAETFDRYTVHRKFVKEKVLHYDKCVTQAIIIYKDQYYTVESIDKSKIYSTKSPDFIDYVMKRTSFRGPPILKEIAKQKAEMGMTSSPHKDVVQVSETKVESTASPHRDVVDIVETKVSSDGSTSSNTVQVSEIKVESNTSPHKDVVEIVETKVSSDGSTTTITKEPEASNSPLVNTFTAKMQGAIKSSGELAISINEDLLRNSVAEEAQMEVDDFMPVMERWKRSITYSFSQLRKHNSVVITSSSFKQRSTDPYEPINYYDGEMTLNCDGAQKKYTVTCIDVEGTLYLARIYIPRKK